MAEKSSLSHLLVALQFGAVAVIVWPFFTQPDGRLPWLAMSALGLVIGAYTVAHNKLGNFGIYPEPLPEAQLITTGPYRWVRHPMYTSLLLVMLGIALYRAAWPNYLGLLPLIAALFGKMQREEAYLCNKFEAYSDYVKRTHRLFPGIY